MAKQSEQTISVDVDGFDDGDGQSLRDSLNRYVIMDPCFASPNVFCFLYLSTHSQVVAISYLRRWWGG